MDAKELRAELTERSNDGAVKFAVQYDRSKCEPGVGAFKGDTAGARPCAVIGPDRVVLPARDAPKKPTEPWLTTDPGYRRLPDYPYKMSDHKDPSRNISPRQTFQENMQRIIMPPGYNAAKLHEDPPFVSKNNKLNAPLEVKYCDVPYNINQVSSEQKHIRNADHSASNVNPLLMRGIPHGWPAGSVHVRPLRTYGAPEVLQYPDYANCAGPRPVLTRTHTSTHDEQLYPDAYYQEGNIRYKPYPNIKERYPQTRYEYLGNYPNPYHPPNPFAHKYELPKTIPPHAYPGYPQIPKYTERMPDPIIDGYQRTFQQGNYSVPIRNPVIHSPYRPVLGNPMQNKLQPYPPDGQHKPVPNKLPYDPASKMYLDYDTRAKPMPIPDNYYLNELPRSYHPKNTIVLPNFASANMHGANAHPCYPLKNYDYPRYKNVDPSMINHSLIKLPPQFSPSTLAISPADSNASNETAQTHGTSQEDCGYASQSSVTSARSIESLNRTPMDAYGRYDYRYNPMVRASASTKPGPSSNQGSKTKKDIRQFISSWSEGDDENAENITKRDSVKAVPDEKHTFSKQYETVHNQEQLYVLGLVNVPSEELSKYEHIQKVSKLPENIKGYNSLELLNQFEEAIESSNITSAKPPTPRAVQMPTNRMLHKHDPVPRALSPLDVEAKISQSVIHKEVGCNFEIKPCSPKMLNVEIATPMQTLLSERVIEKVTNPHNVKSPIMLQRADENIENNLVTKTMKYPVPITASSCKMINSQHLSESPGIDHLKTNYSLQDLESNSGVCLASLPRLDNDIELNFPEVNQQFINANKTDSVITTSFVKDLSALDVDRSAITNNEYDMNYQFSPKTETETDFSRLSKYRKLKRCVPEDNNSELAKAQASRVDSVIIKNPDNTRSLEESTDNTNQGGHFRNNFQEYAINLVSESKHSKEIHQHDVDKMFSTCTSPVVTSKYEGINIHSPNRLEINQSSNEINKQLDVVEETSRNKTVHVQSEEEDFNMHSKDLSNRYLEKVALDIPMNLSPQARYPAIGVDDEIRHSTTGDKTGTARCTLDEKRVEVTCLKNNEEEKPKYSSALSLNKIEDTLTKSQDENIIDTSNNQCLDTRENRITKPDITGFFSSSILKKRDYVRIGKDDHIDNQSQNNDMCNNEKSNAALEIEQIDGLVIEKTAVSEVNRGHEIFDDKRLGESDSTAINSDKITDVIDDFGKPHNTVKKYEKYVTKLKRKKDKSEAKRRKRSFDKQSSTVVDCRSKKEQNLKILSNTVVENPINQSAHKDPPKVLAESNSRPDTNLIHEDIIENFKNTNTSKLGDMAIQFTVLQTAQTDQNYGNENKNAAENITPNCADVTESNISLLCLPIEAKCLESERNETAQNIFPMNFDSNTTNQIVSTVPAIPTEPEKEVPMNLNSSICKANEFDTSSFTAHLGTQSKQNDINLEYKYSDTQVFPDMIDKQKKETNKEEIIYLKNEKVIKMGESDQNESMSSESNTKVSITFAMNKSGDQSENQSNAAKDMQICENSQTDPSKNEDRDVDIPMLNTRDNLSTARSEYGIRAHHCEGVTNKRNCTKKVCHPIVNKELFSPRFQNLLHLNSNIDICFDGGYPKIADKYLSLDEILDAKTHDPTTSTEMNSSAKFTQIVELDVSNKFMPNIVDEAGTHRIEFNKEEVSSDRMEATTAEDCSTRKIVGTHRVEFNKEEVDDKTEATTAEECSNGTHRVESNIKEVDDKTEATAAEACSKGTHRVQFNKEKVDDTHRVEFNKEKVDDKTEATTAEDCSTRKVVGTHRVEFNKEEVDDKTEATTAEECSNGTHRVESNIEEVDDKTEATAAEECSKGTHRVQFNKEKVDDTHRVKFNKEKVDDKTEATTADECSKGTHRVEFNKEEVDDETEAKTAEECSIKNTFSNDCDVNNDFGEITENKGEIKIENPSLEMQLINTEEDTQTMSTVHSLKPSMEKFVTESSCEEDLNECDEDFENHESDFRFSNNVESGTCATNIIVIDETLKMSPDQCHEFSNHGSPVVNDDEFIKKRQSFVQNLTARPRFSLKRSLSDSALNAYDEDGDDCSEKKCFMLPKKRKKRTNVGKIDESHLLKIIQSSRRNSISTLNNENFSFCILIDDHCIVAEENYEQENFVQIEDDLLHHPLKDAAVEDEKITCNLADKHENEQDIYLAKYDEEKSWVEDVGCEETIETEDIAENIVIGDPASPKDADLSDYESDDDIDALNNEAVDHTSKVKHIYGDNMCTNDAQLVDALYRTPQMDVNKKLMDRESHITEKSHKYYDNDTLEMLLAEPINKIARATAESDIDCINCPTVQEFSTDSLKKESEDLTPLNVCSPVVSNLLVNDANSNEKNIEAIKEISDTIDNDKTQDKTIYSCKSSLDNVFIHKEDSSQPTSSFPEVSSTTSEEKNSSILLKISNFKGSRISEVKSLSPDTLKENNCKLGSEEYLKPNYSDGMSSIRPLRTKAAQKYIPPLRESIPDLKVKLALPQQSLLKYQKNKVAKEEPKLSGRNIYNNNIKIKQEIPRKIKPKFEDVLKNIDEAQFQLHKEKNKKAKKYIPKVVIKKSGNGSHYASTSTKESFNPDLTGRKWQPWVFIEKNKFIDDMALRKKTRAVFSHRRKSFVLAEKFCKYKSISSAKFVISQPNINDFCTGNLKYTIKLKHSY